jgi:uncharacterized membrane protein
MCGRRIDTFALTLTVDSAHELTDDCISIAVVMVVAGIFLLSCLKGAGMIVTTASG